MKASKVPLLEACVREGLRMFVPATAAQRVCEKETVLGPATIPAGTTIGGAAQHVAGFTEWTDGGVSVASCLVQPERPGRDRIQGAMS
ncbi:hypothetical protein FNF27_08257 [Cafeteria roenbergensis]|uniref:Uncharacterized protein n=1 Tax=Cafeteria roenbergensis TaxID=33653 RepID=A0A5A8D4V6_CAFRO|nr:hypothetical protein FNF27_08257 [Cafeteria roenbergensis]